MTPSGNPVAPVATYRLQLTPDAGFEAAVERLSHLERLGISHLYLSPIAEAVPGSSHGYDVVDHTAVRAELGGEVGFERLLDAVAARDMAVVFDHVPNHVSTARPELNPRWWAALRDGPGSSAARWFDVDWDIADGRVILPVLGAPLAVALADGAIRVERDRLVVHGGIQLPLAPGTAERDLPGLLADQHYVLQHWRDPARNVRRFFTIDDLVAIRVEDADIAATVDTLPARYAGHPGFGGVRVDHVDGLADPLAYLRGLRDRIGPDALMWVEKIVAPGEWLPGAWPVDGTTGYEFIRACDQAFVADAAGPWLDAFWGELAGDRPFAEWEHAARLEVVAGGLAPDVARLRRQAVACIDGDDAELSAELHRLTTELPRYRTYLPDDPAAATIVRAISNGPVATALLAPSGHQQEALRTRWQQLTGPVMAKGAEDRAFYRYLRLAALCEVGGDPSHIGGDVAGLHADNARRADDWPLAMLASTTHDTKRSGDVRARSSALTWRLAADPGGIGDALRWWTEAVATRSGVDAPTAWLAVQTAATAAGLDADRLADYLQKATREAAVHTTWESPDEAYEARVSTAARVAVLLAPDLDLDRLAEGISLAATAVRLASPGVPDIYQGTAGFRFRLVDPDNRVEPDWPAVERAARDERSVAELWALGDPASKTVLVRTLLHLRRERPQAFVEGRYTALDVEGAVAFRRADDVVVVARRGAAIVTGDVVLTDGVWRDVLDPAAPERTGSVPAAELVGAGDADLLPVVVLVRD